MRGRLCWAGRAGGPRGAAEWRSYVCGKHEQCRAGHACVVGRCEAGRLDEAMDVSEINASQWFVYGDGSCDYDNECGPWMCFEGVCATPETTHRPMLPRRNFRYWDTSCHVSDDCGPWECADGWCTQPGFVSPYASIPESVAETTDGGHCLGDNECDAGADCVFPGRCRLGAADELMTFADIEGPDWYARGDGSCTGDHECGPHACHGGWCVAQELAGRPRQTRDAYFYYDASCSSEDQCGAWTCSDGWCRDPDYR